MQRAKGVAAQRAWNRSVCRAVVAKCR